MPDAAALFEIWRDCLWYTDMLVDEEDISTYEYI